MITLGDGAGDTVNVNSGSYDRIILGNGAGDTVRLKRSTQEDNGSHLPVGDGNGDTVNLQSGA